MAGAAILFLALTLAPGPAESRTSRTGLALWYDIGVMRMVMENRGLPFYPCTLASPYHDINEVVEVTGLRTGHTLRCKVYDVPQTAHRPKLVARGVVAEMDNASARYLCGETRETPPKPRNCIVTVRDVTRQHASASMRRPARNSCGCGALRYSARRYILVE
jgi:hypothetical protein